MSTSACATIALPASSSPQTTLSTPGGQDVGGELGELDRRHGRRRRRLEDDRVAGRQRRADLPDRHHQRVVPRRDLADDADRLAADDRGVALHVLAGRLALEHARAPAKKRRLSTMKGISSLLDGVDRLAGVVGLELGERRRRAPRSRRRGRAAPARARRASSRAQPGKARARGGDGAVDVRAGRVRRRRDRLAGRRVDDLGGAALGGVDELAVDEVLQGRAHGRRRYRTVRAPFGAVRRGKHAGTAQRLLDRRPGCGAEPEKVPRHDQRRHLLRRPHRHRLLRQVPRRRHARPSSAPPPPRPRSSAPASRPTRSTTSSSAT